MKKISQIFSGFAVAVLSLTSLSTAVFGGVAYAAGQTCTWTGATNNTFSTATNWSNCGGAAPTAGDVINFPFLTNTSVTLSNDLYPGVQFGGITMDNAGSTQGEYTIYTFDNLAFGDGAVLKSVAGSLAPSVSGTVTTTGALTIDGRFTVYPTTADITVQPTDLNYINNPVACMGGAPDFMFEVNPTGAVTVGTGSFYGMSGTESSVSVASGAGVGLPAGTYAGTLTFAGGGATQGDLCGDAVSISSGDTILSGTVNLNGGDIVYSIVSGKTLKITGTINGTGNKLTAFSGSTGTFLNSAATNNSATPSGSQTVAQHEVPAVTDNQPTASLTVNPNEILTFDGTRQSVSVSDNAIMKGAGTIIGNLWVAGSVAPGHSPGCMSAGTLSLYGEYQFELGGTTPCTGYDQLKVTDTTGVTVTFGADSVLTTSRYNNYTPKKGQVFTIIDNQSTEAVTGTFKSLPEGATFEQNGVTFKISYVGGTGNDVTLTVMNEPTVPDTGFALIAANPVATLALTAAAALALVVIARKYIQQPSRATSTRKK